MLSRSCPILIAGEDLGCKPIPAVPSSAKFSQSSSKSLEWPVVRMGPSDFQYMR